MKMEKLPIIIIGGPTACGKTDIAIQLAKSIGGEVISADSMQVYRYMDIGTAKATREEMRGIPHHLIDILDPDEDYSVAAFQRLAVEAIEAITAKGKIPIIAGGTGFYLNALLYGTDFIDMEKDENLRGKYQQMAEKQGPAYLHGLLEQVDPAAASAIPFQNVKRVIRALEFFEQTGTRISDHNQRERANRAPRYRAFTVIVSAERPVIYGRINRRVDRMIEKGLLQEVQALMDRGYHENLTSMQGLGYKEIVGYLKGRTTLSEAIELLKQGTRHFAKRQLTWFRRQIDGLWIDGTERSALETAQGLAADFIRYMKND